MRIRKKTMRKRKKRIPNKMLSKTWTLLTKCHIGILFMNHEAKNLEVFVYILYSY